jgi:hypothetical protein
MLTIYAPKHSSRSKCWEVFNGIKHTWPQEVQIKDNSKMDHDPPTNSMFWGFVNYNLDIIRQLELYSKDFWFTDTPYFGRFDNGNLKSDNHYWRIAKNNIHVPLIKNCPADRFKKFNVNTQERNKKGKYILVCPSSYTIQNYIDWNDWHVHITDEIKEYTDRPIVWRDKPRKNGTSGPAVADIAIEEQLKDAWACVTSCSISALEAITQGVPVFCHPKSFAAPIANTHLKHIEDPVWNDPTEWFHSLCYQQFTPEEYANGTAVSIMKELNIL